MALTFLRKAQRIITGKQFKNIPNLRGSLFLGRMANFLEDDGEGIIRLLDESKEIMQAQGTKMCQFWLGMKPALILADEKLIDQFKTKYESHLNFDIPLVSLFLGNTLVNENEDLWHRERKILLQNIHGKSLLKFKSNILRLARQRVNYAAQQKQIEFKSLSMGYALDVFTTNFIGLENNQESIDELVSLLDDITANVFQFRNVFKWMLPATIRKIFFQGEENNLDAVRRDMKRRFTALFEQKKKEEMPEFLKALSQFIRETEYSTYVDPNDKPISPNELFGKLLLLISAAAATTAATMQFSIIYLANHPEVLKKLLTELTANNINSETIINLEEIDFKKLPYLDCIVTEILRMYPPTAFYLPRETVKPFSLDNVSIQAGDLVIATPYIWQNSPNNFHEPNKFNPERYLSDDTIKPKAFSLGLRTCPGKQLALIEVKTMLVTLFTQYNVHLENMKINSAEDLPLTFRGALTPKNPIFGTLDAKH